MPGRSIRPITRRALIGGMAALSIAGRRRALARSASPVGFIASGERSSTWNVLYRAAILDGLAREGLAPSAGLRWHERYAGTKDDVAPLTRELLAEGVAVLICTGSTTRPAIDATGGRVPIVYGFSGDPIVAGLTDGGLSRPRGNATGVTMMSVEINAKRIEILKEIAPAMRRIALLCSPQHPGEAGEVEVCRRTVASLGVDLLYMPVSDTEAVDQALAQAAAAATDALVALPDSTTLASRERIAASALARRIPSASGWAMFPESGALMSFGPNLRASYGRVGQIAARVGGGRQAGRAADRAALPLRAGAQPEDCRGHRPAGAAVGAGARRPGHRVEQIPFGRNRPAFSRSQRDREAPKVNLLATKGRKRFPDRCAIGKRCSQPSRTSSSTLAPARKRAASSSGSNSTPIGFLAKASDCM